MEDSQVLRLQRCAQQEQGQKRLKVTEATKGKTVKKLQMQVEMEESSVQEEQAKSREELATKLGVASTQMVQGVSRKY